MDAFKILGTGLKFDKKKYKKEISIFEEKNVTMKNEKDIMKDLDFFGAEEELVKEIHEKPLETPLKTTEFMSADEIRKIHRIKVTGTDIPDPLQSFVEMCERYKIPGYLKKNLEQSHYSAPTPIQRQAIPLLLQKRDLIACAPTGSGKTLSFVLPIIKDLKAPSQEGFRALIITPTRELAQQIHRELIKISTGRKFKVCVLSKIGNVANENNVVKYKNFDILISTPLRLVHALKHESMSLHRVNHIVLDEADRLLELGFLEQVDEILAACTSPTIQKALFSATISSSVEELARTFMRDPVRIIIGLKNSATESIKQQLVFVGQEEGKMIAIRQMLCQGIRPPVLIFVQTIERAKELFHELVFDRINVDVIHAERTKAQRDAIIQNFRLGKIWVLISTELMARGIDFKGVNLVINYDFPQSVASYIHRIGRTGRAGHEGEAITYFTKEDAPYLKSIVNVMKDSGCQVPEWMLELKAPTQDMKNTLKNKAIQRQSINTGFKKIRLNK